MGKRLWYTFFSISVSKKEDKTVNMNMEQIKIYTENFVLGLC